MSKELSDKRRKFLEKIRQSKAIAKPSPGKIKVSRSILQKAASSSSTRKGFLFALDATASRDNAWKVSKKITKKMFDVIPGQLNVALAYYGGGELTVTPYADNASVFADKLAAISCRTGGTQINELLSEAAEMRGLRCLSMIGDCFEEDADVALDCARSLRLKGIKVFFFHDTSSAVHGYDTHTAGRVFRSIVDITGGAVLDFNENAVKDAEDLLSAVAVFAAGGRKLLESRKKELPGAVKLLEKLS